MGRSKKVAFTDLRDWIATLEERGQLSRVKGQVDWQYEMGHIIRRTWDVYGDASPAILFENIKDYPPPGPSRLFTGAFRTWYRTAMMLGLDPDDTSRTEVVQTLRQRINNKAEHLKPRIVKTGPVKENILLGKDVDLTKFPIPHLNERDWGRSLGSFHAVVTKDPDGD